MSSCQVCIVITKWVDVFESVGLVKTPYNYPEAAGQLKLPKLLPGPLPQRGDLSLRYGYVVFFVATDVVLC